MAVENGTVLRVVVMPEWPYVYRSVDHPKGHNQNSDLEKVVVIDGWSGIGIDLLYQIGTQLGYTNFQLRLPPDKHWGEKQADGKWDGLCGVLARGEADVGVANNDYNPDRIKDFEGLRLPFDNDKTVWISERNLERPARQLWTLVRILDTETWLSALLCLIAVIVVVRLVRYALNASPLSMIELRIFGVVFGQCDYGTADSVAEQLLLASFSISMMLFLFFYSASLIAEFTVDEEKLPFTSTKEMYDKGYRIAVVAESLSDLRLFEKSPKPWENSLYDSRPTKQEFFLNESFFHHRDFYDPNKQNHVIKTYSRYGLVLGHTQLTNNEVGCSHPWVPAVVSAFSNPAAIMLFSRTNSRAMQLYREFLPKFNRYLQYGLIRAAVGRVERGSNASTVVRCSNARYRSHQWKWKQQKSNGHESITIETFQSPLILIALGCGAGALMLTAELFFGQCRRRLLQLLWKSKLTRSLQDGDATAKVFEGRTAKINSLK